MSSIKVYVSVETLHNKHHGKENWVATLDIRTLNFDCQIFIKASYFILTYFSFHICSILTFIVSISVRILFTLFLCRFAFSLQKSDEKSSSAATRSTAMHENNIVTNITADCRWSQDVVFWFKGSNTLKVGSRDKILRESY